MSLTALNRYLEPLQPFLQEDGVTEICINQPQQVFIEKNSEFSCHRVEKLTLSYLEILASLIAEFNHKEFPCPLLSGTLPHGERIQCVMHPACEKERFICAIRRQVKRDLSLDDYSTSGAFDDITHAKKSLLTADDVLRKLYEKKDFENFLSQAILAKKNIVISGGTGTGKTTFLNACLRLIPTHERLITLEDTREVIVKQANHASLLFNEEDADITALKLFKTCLRLRPDRIFLSELRGAEAWPFLRAANSGHPGSLSTVHADTPQACFEQLVFMVQQAGSTWNNEQLLSYIKSIIPIVVQLSRSTEKNRFMKISEIYFNEPS